MRWVTLILVALVLVLQYPLWFGKGGWMKVWELDRQLEAQQARSLQIHTRNRALEAEVLDLKQGFEAVEERARSELGMVKREEIYFQVMGDFPALPDPPATSTP